MNAAQTILASRQIYYQDALLGADIILRQMSDQPLSTAGFTDITGLKFAVAAQSNYPFEAFIIYQTSATAMGVRFAVNGPASPNLVMVRSQKQLTVGGTPSSDMFSDAILTAYDTPLHVSLMEPAATTNLLCMMRGVITTGSSGGVFALRFDKENVAGTATVKAGSFLKYRVVA